MDARNENVTRALIMIHGASRSADDYFRTALAAAFLAGALDDTIVIAPRFAANNAGDDCRDSLALNELMPDPTPGSVFVITAYELGEKARKALRRRQKSSRRKKP
jgi:hypothetical protein